MKTSNKLLLIALALLLSGMFYTVYKVKTMVGTVLVESDIILDDIELTGDTFETEYELDEFEKIMVNGSIKAKLIQSDEDKIVLKGDSALFRYIDISVINDRLSVSLTKIKGRKVQIGADIYTSYNDLEELNANAGAQLSCDNVIEVPKLKVEANAGAFINLELKCDEVECSSNAGAQVTLKGAAVEFVGTANAGAFIKAKKLKADVVKASANAGGQMYVYSAQKLKASCMAGGSVTYYGNPDKVNKSTMVGGILKKGD